MNCVSNFFLLSRQGSTSTTEKVADFLLRPARSLLGGQEVMVFHDGSVHLTDDKGFPLPEGFWGRTAGHIKTALVLLPWTALGTILKLSCCRSENYREFLFKEFSAAPECHPKLLEMFQHVHSTDKFISDPRRGALVFNPLQLEECTCPGSGAFHRLYSPRRDNLENAIVSRLVDIQVDKSAPIKLLSMGSGGLMSDFITLEKLVLAGFKSIEIDCVDPKGIDPVRVQNIKDFFATYPDVSLAISAYKKVDELPEKRRDYCAVLAVDYDHIGSRISVETLTNALADLMKARSRLSENGFLALGFSEEDTLSGKGMDPIILTPGLCRGETLIADLVQHLSKKYEVRVAVPDLRFPVVSTVMYALAIVAEKFPEHYGRISISSLNPKEDPNYLQNFQAMLPSLFPGATTDFSIHEEGRKYDCLFTGSLEPIVNDKTYLNLLEQEAITYILYPRGDLYRQTGTQENSRTKIM